MERGKRFKIVAAVAVLTALVCFGARAELVGLPLDCAGTYEFSTPAWMLDFDLGVTFTEISHVYIDWAGEITGALVTPPPGPGDPYPIDVVVAAYLGHPPNWRYTQLGAGAGTYPAPEPFDTSSEFTAGAMPFSELFDGQGEITIQCTELQIPGSYLERGFVDLRSATLVVQGTIVPEPSTLLLLAVGVCGLSRSHHTAKVV